MADIHIELYPLDKMIINGIEIKLGMSKQDVIALLGKPESSVLYLISGLLII